MSPTPPNLEHCAVESYLAEDDLRREVLRGPTQCPRPPLHSLGEPEICDLSRRY